ncbi:Do family serine endopeptidase [Litorimonas sp. RW-G-Af-16]|uniref:Do family serine endopeptidase n=1 Tax=Litorimonas sp. RW-G-Af-16 TaxID=3241168 RepID=UPI00390CB605
MRKYLLMSAAGLVVIGASFAPQFNVDAQSRYSTQSEAMMVDPTRGVLTMAPLLERVTPAVVSINVIGKTKPAAASRYGDNEELLERFFGGRLPDMQPQPRNGLGSGVIIDAGKGLILTNNHVVANAEEINVTLEDKRQLQAELVGTDPKTDIALLRVDASNLRALEFAPTNDVQVGDYVIAVGNPFGLSSTVTSGIVSALGRDSSNGDNYSDFIQTDASINPGNSGGALVNSKGELIGINTAIISRSGGNNGIGFAVPVRIIKSVMGQLEENGEVRRGRIGVSIQNITPELREAMGLTSLNGALVGDVVDGTPAEKAGLKRGDVVIEFNGEDVLDSSDLRNAVGLVQPGTRADITFMRDGKRRTTRIEVAEVEEDKTVLDESVADELPSMESFDGASITNIPDDMELRGGDEGVLVATVKRGSKAARSGLRRGDIIRSVDGNDIRDLSDFEDAISEDDGPFALSVERDGTNIFLAVK